MKQGLRAYWVLLACALTVACGSDDEDVYCCALAKVAANCQDATLDQIAASENAEACRFRLEQNELGCSVLSTRYDEDSAIAECAAQ